MFNIEQLTQYSFTNPQLLTTIKSEVDDFADHLMGPEAYKMAQELESKLKELASQETSQPQIFAQYRQILIRLKFISISIWDDNTFFDLIKNNLANILGSDIDINERMTGKLYTVPDLAWSQVAQQILDVLRQNVQPIGGRQLMIPGEKVPHPPLIKYWLLDYDRSMGMERHENIQRAKYFTDSRNFLGLSEADKLKVQQLLEFYDGLKPLPLPEEEIRRPLEEGAPTIAIPRQRGEEGEFAFEREETPEFPYPDQQAEPSPSFYQPPAKPAAPPPQPSQRPSQPPGALPTGQPTPSAPPPPPPSPPQQKDAYREQVAPQDLAGPQAAPRPAPKLNGNVINLKDLGTGQQ